MSKAGSILLKGFEIELRNGDQERSSGEQLVILNVVFLGCLMEEVTQEFNE